MQRLLSATAIIVAGLALAACDPPVNHAADPTPTPVRSSSAPPSTPSAPISYRYDVFQMASAVPATYHGLDLNPGTYIFSPNLTPVLRPDPLAGLKISPEKCRAAVRGMGLRNGQEIPSETPAADGQAGLGSSPDAFVLVVVAETTGAVADRFMASLPDIDPACASIRFTGSGDRASVTRRSLPGSGDRTSYLVRSYPRAGKPWTERILLYRTPRYVVRTALYAPAGSEADFLAFSRQTWDLAASKLK